MWFRRKPKNRRLGREQVLDVKLRSSQVRAARTRLTAISLGAVFTTVFGLYLAYRVGDWALDCLVYQNKAFAIEEIDVQTDGVIAVDQLRRWAGVRLEENLLALDLWRVKRVRAARTWLERSFTSSTCSRPRRRFFGLRLDHILLSFERELHHALT